MLCLWGGVELDEAKRLGVNVVLGVVVVGMVPLAILTEDASLSRENDAMAKVGI